METLAARIDRAGPLETGEAVILAARLARALEGPHERNVAHGAVSPESVLVDRDDLSTAVLRASSRSTPSLHHQSPERLSGSEPSAEDDVWALGSTLYVALTGTVPFPGSDATEVAARIRQGSIAPLAVFDAGDDDLQELLEGVFHPQNGDRVRSATRVRRSLTRWLAKRGIAPGPALEIGSAESKPQVDLSSIPPPPRLPDTDDRPTLPRAATAGSAGVLYTFADEDTTLPRDASSDSFSPPSFSRNQDAPLSSRLPPTSELLARAKAAPSRAPESGPTSSAPGQLNPNELANRLKRGSIPPSGPRLNPPRAALDRVKVSDAAPPFKAPALPPLPEFGVSDELNERAKHLDLTETPPPLAALAVPPLPEPSSSNRGGSSPPSSRKPPTLDAPPPSSKKPPPLPDGDSVPSSKRPPPLPDSAPTSSVKPPLLPVDSADAESRSQGRESSTAPADRERREGIAKLVPEVSLADSSATPQSDAGPRESAPRVAGSAKKQASAKSSLSKSMATATDGNASPSTIKAESKSRFGSVVIAAVVLGSAVAAFELLGVTQRVTPVSDSATPVASVSPTSATRAAHTQPTSSGSVAPSASVASLVSSSSSSVVSAEAVASASVAPSASGASTASPVAPASGDASQCIVKLFPADSFAQGAHPSLDFVCRETDPRAGSQKVHEALVVAGMGRTVSDGMREWAVMGWYELAAYASLRGRCCDGAPPLELPPSPGSCTSMQDALNDIAKASRLKASDAEQIGALAGFRKSLSCTLKSGKSKTFGSYSKPAGGEDTAFSKTLQRTRIP